MFCRQLHFLLLSLTVALPFTRKFMICTCCGCLWSVSYCSCSCSLSWWCSCWIAWGLKFSGRICFLRMGIVYQCLCWPFYWMEGHTIGSRSFSGLPLVFRSRFILKGVLVTAFIERFLVLVCSLVKWGLAEKKHQLIRHHHGQQRWQRKVWIGRLLPSLPTSG